MYKLDIFSLNNPLQELNMPCKKTALTAGKQIIEQHEKEIFMVKVYKPQSGTPFVEFKNEELLRCIQS